MTDLFVVRTDELTVSDVDLGAGINTGTTAVDAADKPTSAVMNGDSALSFRCSRLPHAHAVPARANRGQVTPQQVVTSTGAK